jgi:hypothetical protein
VSAPDEAGVRALYHQLMGAWNRGSGDDWAAAFTEDGHLVAFDGTHFRGRQEIGRPSIGPPSRSPSAAADSPRTAGRVARSQ